MASRAARLASIGANVRRLRLKLGLTQEQLAEVVVLSPRHIQILESGQGNPAASTLIDLADKFGVKPGDLFRLASPPERRAGRPTTKRASTSRRRL